MRRLQQGEIMVQMQYDTFWVTLLCGYCIHHVHGDAATGYYCIHCTTPRPLQTPQPRKLRWQEVGF